MSWSDQILDELGSDWKKRLKIKDRKMLLFVFAIHLAEKYKIKLDEKELDKDIDEFLKEIKSKGQ